MKRIVAIAFSILWGISSLSAQQFPDYLLDSLHTKNINSSSTFESGTKYFYDDQDRLIRLQRPNSYFIYSYESDQRQLDVFNTQFDELISSQVEFLNEDGYTVRIEYSRFLGGETNPIRVDSILLNEDNFVLQSHRYQRNGEDLYLLLQRNRISHLYIGLFLLLY